MPRWRTSNRKGTLQYGQLILRFVTHIMVTQALCAFDPHLQAWIKWWSREIHGITSIWPNSIVRKFFIMVFYLYRSFYNPSTPLLADRTLLSWLVRPGNILVSVLNFDCFRSTWTVNRFGFRYCPFGRLRWSPSSFSLLFILDYLVLICLGWIAENFFLIDLDLFRFCLPF